MMRYTEHFLQWRRRTFMNDIKKIHGHTPEYIELIYARETGRLPFEEKEKPKIHIAWVIILTILITALTIYLNL